MKQGVFFILFSFVVCFSVFAQKAETERKYFEEAYQEINAMLTDQKPVSFKRAVFLSENAYLNNTLSYSAFDLAIKSTAFYIQQTAENLKLKHPKEKPLSVNYAIFQYITDTTYRVVGDKVYRYLPYRYDFSDFNGQKDWRKMFVTKLLEEGTGNCRSLPYFYKLLADECKVEANLALAPNHIYIKHRDVGKREEGWLRRMYNVELTNGSFPMDGWIVASGYITLDGIRNALFMDTLSAKQSVGLCLLDLAKGYERKFGVKGAFVTKCVEAVLKVQPFNINALLLKAELLKEQYDKNKTPANFQLLETHCGNLVKWGYREMPIEMYLNWLFEIRAKSNAFDSVHYKPKKFDTQKYNPMKDDKKLNIKMHTLTDGRFDEFPEHAETTYVGSAVYDIYNKKIVGFIKRDTLYSETLLEPDVVSRWLSLDPIVHPYESPYVGFANNPIYFVDPNGTTVVNGDWFAKQKSEGSELPTYKYLGSDGKNDNMVFITENASKKPHVLRKELDAWHAPLAPLKDNSFNFSATRGLTSENLKDQAHWIYGEGGGNQSNEFAHVMINRESMINQHVALLKSTYFSWKVYHNTINNDFLRENEKLTTPSQSIKLGYGNDWEQVFHKGAPAMDNGKENKNYAIFWNAKGSYYSLMKLNKVDDIFNSIFNSRLGISKDPIPNLSGWRSGVYPNNVFKTELQWGNKTYKSDK